MDVGDFEKRLILVGTLMSLFVAALNQTTVTTALPSIIGDLGGLNLFSWVFTAFMLTSTTTMPLAGKLSDIFGRKPFFLAGITILLLSSLAASSSGSMEQLIFWRAIQGFGSGMMMGNAFAIIGDMFPPAERGKYQGLFSASFGIASIMGPLVGGLLTDLISWRAIFYMNLPPGIIATALLWRFYPMKRTIGPRRPVDYTGAALLVTTTVPLLLALVWGGHEFAWTSPEILSLFAITAGSLVFLLWNETRAVEPIIPLPLFRRRFFAVATTLSLVSGMGLFGAVNYMPTFVQGVMGTSAANSAFVTSPMMLGMVVASTFSGIIASRTGKFRWMIIGGSVGIAGGMFLLSQLTIDSSVFVAAAAMIIIGLGIGSSMPIVNLLVQNNVPHSMLGVVSSSNQFFRQIGGTLGTAIFGTIVVNELRANLDRQLSDQLVASTPPDLLETLEEPRTLLSPEALDKLRDGYAALGPAGDGLYDAAILAMRLSLADALSVVFVVGFVCTAIGLVVSLFIPESGALRDTWDEPGEPAAPPAAVHGSRLQRPDGEVAGSPPGKPAARPQQAEGEPAG
jgi:EmrB/QacA subfamily drug resistance transporter